MFWLTWRQHRLQLLTMVALLVGLGVLLLVNGLATLDYIKTSAPAGCPDLGRDDCLDTQQQLSDRTRAVRMALDWLPIAPALVGAFWGAPLLAREFETGTNKLVWTQALPLRRWLTTKLALIVAAVVLAGFAMSAMITVWMSQLRGVEWADRFGNSALFMLVGILPAAWWLFAFAVGTAVGTLIRKTLPAMAVTIAVVFGAILAMFFFQVREHYATPVQQIVAAPAENRDGYTMPGPTGSMLVHMGWIDSKGTRLNMPPADVCRPPSPREPMDRRCLADKGYREVIEYHPANRFWRFQLTEAGGLLLLTLALGGLAVARTIRRPA